LKKKKDFLVFKNKKSILKPFRENILTVCEIVNTLKKLSNLESIITLESIHYVIDSKIIYLQYPYYDQGDLRVQLESENFELSDIQFQNIVNQLLESISSLEKHGIVHCDIKPENIFVKYESLSNMKVVLGDFNASHDLKETQNTTRVIRTTKGYSAPEILTHLTCSCDMYSLGKVLDELKNKLCKEDRGKYDSLIDSCLKENSNYRLNIFEFRDKWSKIHEIYKCPSTWKHIKNALDISQKFKIQEIKEKSVLYKVIQNIIKNEKKEIKITKIELLEHARLWHNFINEKISMSCASNEEENKAAGINIENNSNILNVNKGENYLFHGTSSLAFEEIKKIGFKINKNGGNYGKGIYFTKDANEAYNYATKKKVLVISRVVLGKVVKEKKTKDTKYYEQPPEDFDSVSGFNSDEVVVYDSAKCYPEYIVYVE